MPNPKVKILLVDDRVENLISLTAILDSPDYELVTVESGQNALKRLMHEEFALILLDVQMPTMDGFETANLIKKREKSRHIPIIFVTALSLDAPYLFRGYSVGAVDYMIKPFDPTILRSKVAVFAELYLKKQQLEQQSQVQRENERLAKEREITRVELTSLKREQASNEKYKDLVENLQDGIVWSANARTMHFSYISPHAGRIIGGLESVSVESYLEQNLLRNPALVQRCQELLLSLASATSPIRDFSFEQQLTRPDGTALWLQTSVRIAEDEQTNCSELRGISIDVTRLKEAEQEAQAAAAVRDQFLSIASHELKTPLTPLSLQLQMLQKIISADGSQISAPKISACVDRLYRQVNRLTHLIDELLDVSRMNNGKLFLDREDVMLRELLNDVSGRLKEDLLRSGSSLQIELEDKILGNWDRLRIEQVFTNLLTNAIKYGGGKPIKIYATADGDLATIQVCDAGIGIKEEDQDRIFRPFERAVGPMQFNGLGLGLFIVRQIVDAHGGSITLDSSEKDGSTFTIVLPLFSSSMELKKSSNTSVIESKNPEILH